ncbi:hypothetical protein AMECASPLE_031790 [Ameca splendens]|uniref:Uncharacterized protein n=1 Tax=Ameca splendens TaxID=208324 RepID=A0ABV0Z567_9TELE
MRSSDCHSGDLGWRFPFQEAVRRAMFLPQPLPHATDAIAPVFGSQLFRTPLPDPVPERFKDGPLPDPVPDRPLLPTHSLAFLCGVLSELFPDSGSGSEELEVKLPPLLVSVPALEELKDKLPPHLVPDPDELEDEPPSLLIPVPAPE